VALPPSGKVLTQQVVQLILEHWYASDQTAVARKSIAGIFATSVPSVARIISKYEAEGVVRVSKQGQGKQLDPRNFFGVAGASGPANLLRLESAYGAGKVDDYIGDIRDRYLADGFGYNARGQAPDESTVGKALRALDYTGKQMSKRARERDHVACEKWMETMSSKYVSNQLVFLDETCAPPHPLPTPRAPSSATPPLALLRCPSWEWPGMTVYVPPTASMAAPRRAAARAAHASSTAARPTLPSVYVRGTPTRGPCWGAAALVPWGSSCGSCCGCGSCSCCGGCCVHCFQPSAVGLGPQRHPWLPHRGRGL
jgi:hypothetical protein